MGYCTGQTLLTTTGTTLAPPSITVTSTSNSGSCNYGYPNGPCTIAYIVNYVIPVGYTLNSLTLQRTGGNNDGWVLDSFNYTSANISFSRSASSGTINYSGTYRFEAVISGNICISNNFDFSAAVTRNVVLVLTDGIDYSNTCVYTNPPSTGCRAVMRVRYFLDAGGTVTAHSLQKISGTDFNINTSSLGNYIDPVITTQISAGSASGIYRISATSSLGTFFSTNFNLTATAAEGAAPTPTINVTGPSSGTCNFVYPDTNCIAQVIKNYSISNYSTGIPFAELVSGTSLTTTRSGSNSSGTFTFSKATTDTAATTSTYKIGITINSVNYYSSNFTIDLSATETAYNLGVGLVYTKDCENLSDVPTLIQDSNNVTYSIVTGKVANCLRSVFANNTSNFTIRSVHNTLSVGQPFTYSMWFKCTQPYTSTASDFINLLNVQLFYSGSVYTDAASMQGSLFEASCYYSYLQSWNNLCVWYDGNILYASLNNGKTDNISNSSLKARTVGSGFRFISGYVGVSGRNNNGTDSYMEIDSLFVWNRVLNEAERNVLYNNGNGRAGSTLPSLIGS